jgi:hypothetical protein
VPGPGPIGLPGRRPFLPGHRLGTGSQAPVLPSGGSLPSFAAKYTYSFFATAWQTLRAGRSGHFAVFRAYSPPDICWPIATAFRAIEGTRFAFDHHHLYPEPCEASFPVGARLRYRTLCAQGRRAQRSAGHVIATLIRSEDCFDGPVALRGELGPAGTAEFAGRAPRELVTRVPSCAGAGLSVYGGNPLKDSCQL